MAEIINSTYEIIRELGSGGGGVAYLANHLRLNKKVVLKADRRIVWFNADLLRREADVLKNLSHANIPHVYDYFIEQDTAITVIDYIEGESLDKPLKRGETFSQPQVIQWAIQILDALDYLHRPIHGDPPRGFVHGDIKPSNIMRKPDGNICLIDFNVALAFGEGDTVGRTAGYSSPEHYGLEFSSGDYGTVNGFPLEEELDVDDDTPTMLAPKDRIKVSASGPSAKKVLPDIRSDIYSLGATLYHFLGGKKPAKNAQDVVPLSKQEFSPQLVDIISKAMNPNPDLRYQSAEEMKNAFLGLWDNDIRVKRMRIRNRSVFIACALFLAAGIFAAFIGLKRIQTREQWLKLAEYSENALEDGDSVQALDFALQALDKSSGVFQPDYIPEAQKALTDALGIYDLSDGFKPYRNVELPEKPQFIRMSPDGTTVICLCSHTFIVIDTDTGEIINSLPSALSALAEAEYLDDHTIIYAGEEGITAYDLAEKKTLWTGEPATAISISGDGRRVVGVYKDETYASVYDTMNGKQKGIFDFNGKHQYYVPVYDSFAGSSKRLHYDLLELNADGNLLGVSFSDGELDILNLQMPEAKKKLVDPGEGYLHFEGGFCKQYLAYSASNSAESVFEAVNTETSYRTGLAPYSTLYGVQCRNSGIYLKQQNHIVEFHPELGQQRALVTMNEVVTDFSSNGIYTVAGSQDYYAFFDENANEISHYPYKFTADFVLLQGDKSVIGSMNTNRVQILDLEQHLDHNFLTYDTQLKHYEARVSDDEEHVMLFSPSEFRIYDRSGKSITQVDLSKLGFLYDQQFHREDGRSWLEVTCYDGHVIRYDASDGTVLSEEQIVPLDRSLLETFETTDYRIRSSLYGAPEVYRKENDQFVRYLSEEAYLTNIMETEDYLIAQYNSYNLSERYGILMNKKCDVLAKLPYLCDLVNETLYFDYPSGYIRSVSIYDLEQLKNMADEKGENKS